jgi:hypothetical protein
VLSSAMQHNSSVSNPRNQQQKEEIERACRLYAKAGVRGDDIAQLKIGFAYHTGVMFDGIDMQKKVGLRAEVAIDLGKAVMYYSHSANQGNVVSQRLLTLLLPKIIEKQNQDKKTNSILVVDTTSPTNIRTIEVESIPEFSSNSRRFKRCDCVIS